MIGNQEEKKSREMEMEIEREIEGVNREEERGWKGREGKEYVSKGRAREVWGKEKGFDFV